MAYPHLQLKLLPMNLEIVNESLSANGYAILPSLLTPHECREIIRMYDQPIYRNTIDMQRYRFGKGEYKYFQYPLPEIIQRLRNNLYPPLSAIANEWAHQLSTDMYYPKEHHEFIEICTKKDQTRPTPLILRYQPGGYNTLHQDLYGDIYFPFQVVIVLSQARKDFTGGEFVMTEQIPRAQSKAIVLQPDLGDGIVFTTHSRPVKGSRGYYRAHMKHGISVVKSGERFALGIIFHDAA